ncbi:hypothetical protein [Priestia megaterium]
MDILNAKASKKEIVGEYIVKNLAYLYFESGSGATLKYPNFKLYPRDYLKYAQYELNEYLKTDNAYIHLINCISHLKRAIDCQLDINLHALNLYKIFEKKNLKFGKKLEFFKDIGIFNSRTLERFNAIRNKMEHYYDIPEVQDIEVYFDLVNAFIALLEAMLIQLVNTSNISLNNFINDHGEGEYGDANDVNVEIEYIYEDPKIIVKFGPSREMENVVASVNEDREAFSYFLKLLILFYKRANFISDDYLLQELNYC